MKLEAHGLRVDTPEGWEARITRHIAPHDGTSTKPVLHAATFAIPEGAGDYGSRAVEAMESDDVFLALIEFGEEAVDSALFARSDFPRKLNPHEFRSDGMQRWIPGQAAYQKFFTHDGRAFVLYIVIGNHADRVALARTAETLLATIHPMRHPPVGQP